MNNLCLVQGDRKVSSERQKSTEESLDHVQHSSASQEERDNTMSGKSKATTENSDSANKGLLPAPALLPFDPSYLEALNPKEGKKTSTPNKAKTRKQSLGLKTRGLSGLIASLRRGEVNLTAKPSNENH